MKLNPRVWLPIGLAVVTLMAAPLSASAQEAHLESLDYVGIGVGLGDIGKTDVGLTLNSKIELTDQVSLRPAVISDLDFDDNGETLFLIPATYDFQSPLENQKLLPFAGLGVSVSTEGDDDVGLLLTGGTDYRLSDRVTLNGSVYWSLFDWLDDDQVNGVISIGYNF